MLQELSHFDNLKKVKNKSKKKLQKVIQVSNGNWKYGTGKGGDGVKVRAGERWGGRIQDTLYNEIPNSRI